MLVNISMIKSMAKVNFNGNQEIFTKVLIIKMKEMVMVRCILQMEPFTKAIGKEEYKMEEQL